MNQAQRPVANPPEEIVPTPVSDEVHVAVDVRILLLPSAYTPVAINCRLAAIFIDGSVGITVMVRKSGVIATISIVLPEIPPEVAVIVEAPGATSG